jgi:hypothetical protein
MRGLLFARHAAFAVMLGAATLFAPSAAHAITVSVAPADTTVSPGDVFTLRVTVDAVSDLKAFSLIHTFDISRLQFLGATAGEVLTRSPNPYAFFVTPDVAPSDSAQVDAAHLVGSGTGSGIMVFLQFKALALGVSPIDCPLADLRDALNVPSVPLRVPGIVRIVGPTGVRRVTWGALRSYLR